MVLSRAMKEILVSIKMFVYLLIFLSANDGPKLIYWRELKSKFFMYILQTE